MEFINKIKSNPDALFGKGCTEEDVLEAESSLGLSFAEDYKDYLLNLSSMALDGREFTGITKVKRVHVVEVTKQQRKYDPSVPLSWYVIEEANIDGLVAWQDKSGAVYETMPGKKAKKAADSFSSYLGL